MRTEKQRANTYPNRWKKGQSGNPVGRPRKDLTLTSLIKKYLEEVPQIEIGGKVNTRTWRELVAQAWLVGAYKGNSLLFKELLERLDGKTPQPLTGVGGGPLTIRVEYEKPPTL
mgnify:CR=1 FL=1